MKGNTARQVRPGARISYDDGRPGHQDVRATVLEVTEGHGMLVQFDDRADTTYILFSDARWMDSICVVE
jgi:hypothetical protein